MPRRRRGAEDSDVEFLPILIEGREHEVFREMIRRGKKHRSSSRKG